MLIASGTSCSSSQSSYIYGGQSGSSLKSNDVSATISQHSTNGGFSFDVKAATGGSDSNPFTTSDSSSSSGGSSGSSGSGSTGSSGTGTTSGGATACRNKNGGTSTSSSGASQTSSGSGFPFGPGSTGGFTGSPFPSGFFSKRADDDDCSDTGSNNQNSASEYSTLKKKQIAHGVIAALCFAVLFPIGGIVLRVFTFPGVVWFHAGFQMITWFLFIVAFALGVSMAQTSPDYVSSKALFGQR